MLLSYLEATNSGGKKSSSFEKAVLDYYLSNDFKDLILHGLPDNLTNNQTAALCFVDLLVCLFEG